MHVWKMVTRQNQGHTQAAFLSIAVHWLSCSPVLTSGQRSSLLASLVRPLPLGNPTLHTAPSVLLSTSPLLQVPKAVAQAPKFSLLLWFHLSTP